MAFTLVFMSHGRLRVGRVVRRVLRAAVALPHEWQRADTFRKRDLNAQVPRLQERCAATCWYVDPHAIKYRLPKVLNAPVGTVMDERFVLAGYWDAFKVPYRCNPTVRQRFIDGRPMEATDEYRLMKDLLEAGRKPRGRQSQAEVDAYFQRLERTYYAIRDEGYRTQRELGEKGDNEIGVYVDRLGGLVWARQGDHRLSIAQLLGLKAVPVLVRGVHAKWAWECADQHGGDFLSSVLKGLERLQARAESS